MKRLLVFTAILGVLVVVPAAAKPGQNGPPGPAGNPNADPVSTGSTNATSGGSGAAAPGNSGNNPHGGPPGLASGSSGTGVSAGSSSQAATSSAPAQVPAQAPVSSTPAAGGGGNGNGPADKITICHATHSETNPYVVITISENGLHGHGRSGHQDDEDVIPAAADGTCGGAKVPTEEPPGHVNEPDNRVVAEQHGKTHVAAENAGAAGPSARPGNSRGTLPFTGLFIGLLLAAGVSTLTGGFGMRRLADAVAGRNSTDRSLERRRLEVGREASAWTDWSAARTDELGARIDALQR